MADRIVIMARGRIVLEGNSPSWLVSNGDEATTVLFGAPPALDTASLAEAVAPAHASAEVTPGRYRVEATTRLGPPSRRRSPPTWPSAAPR